MSDPSRGWDDQPAEFISPSEQYRSWAEQDFDDTRPEVEVHLTVETGPGQADTTGAAEVAVDTAGPDAEPATFIPPAANTAPATTATAAGPDTTHPTSSATSDSRPGAGTAPDGGAPAVAAPHPTSDQSPAAPSARTGDAAPAPAAPGPAPQTAPRPGAGPAGPARPSSAGGRGAAPWSAPAAAAPGTPLGTPAAGASHQARPGTGSHAPAASPASGPSGPSGPSGSPASPAGGAAADPFARRPGAPAPPQQSRAAAGRARRAAENAANLNQLHQAAKARAADTATKAARNAVGAATGGVGAAAMKAAELTGVDKLVVRYGVRAAAGLGMFLVAALVAIFIGGAALVTAASDGRGFPLPKDPDRMRVTIDGKESTAAELMPPAPRDNETHQGDKSDRGWAEVVYGAQSDTRTTRFGVPWTLLAGLARAQSDFGRRSPYDSIDRDPRRDPMYGAPVGADGSSGRGVSAAYDGPVLVVGDDVASGLAQRLTSRVPNTVQVIGSAGTTPADVVSSLPADLGDVDLVVVAFQVPTGRTAAQTAGDVRRVLRKVGDGTSVHWALGGDPRHPGATRAYNTALRQVAADASQLQLVSWSDGARSVSGDGTPTDAGYNALTRKVASAVETATVSGGWVLPLPAGSYRMSAYFRQQGSAWSLGYHTGQDFAAPEGTPIFAASDGVVTKAEWHSSYGNHVRIMHPGGVETLYAHMVRPANVTKGDRVRAGQRIGSVGTTGNSFGNHLHFEAIVSGTWSDPMKYLPRSARAAVAALFGAPTAPQPLEQHPHLEHDHGHGHADRFGDAPESSPDGHDEDSGWAPGLLHAGADDCAVPTIAPAIGGKANQAGGAFLLRPEHLEAMAEDDLDPQNPCDQASYVAEQLVEAGTDLVREREYRGWESDTKVARRLWGAVITNSQLFADPVTGKVTCEPSFPITEANAAYAFRSTIDCEAQRADAVRTVVAATTGRGGQVGFDELTGLAAADQVATETIDVAHAFSGLEPDRCRPHARYAGLFPLTAAEAKTIGVSDRCDAKQVVAKVSKALVAAEAVPVADRDRRAGKFAPMLGGWAQFSYPLAGSAGTFSRQGPPQQWTPTPACATGIDTWVSAVVGGHPAPLDAVLADGKVTDDEHRAVSRLLARTSPNPHTSLCADATDAEFFQQVALSAESLAAIATDPGYAAEPAAGEPAHDHPDDTGNADGGSGEDAGTPAVPGDPDRAARLELVGGHAAGRARGTRTPDARPGRDPLVARLATVERTVPVAPDRGYSAAGVRSFPIAEVAVEYAIGYGGIRPPWDTADESVLGAGELGDNVAFGGGKVGVVVAAAKSQIGVPYSWGGGGSKGPSKGFCDGTNGYLNGSCSASVTVGFDCSGLMEYAFSKAGYSIGGTSNAQKTAGRAVTGGLAKAEPGDLLFWGAPTTYHVALYLGDNKMIEAPRTGKNVQIAAVTPGVSYIRRVLPPGSGGSSTVSFPATADSQALARRLPPAGKRFAPLFVESGRKHNLDPALLAGLARQESAFNPTAGSPAGAQGLMQFMPATAAGFGIDPHDPVQSVDAAAKYLRQLYNQFGSMELMLAGYNAGPGNVSKYNGVPPFAETRHYVRQVPQYCRQFGGCSGGAVTGGRRR